MNETKLPIAPLILNYKSTLPSAQLNPINQVRMNNGKSSFQVNPFRLSLSRDEVEDIAKEVMRIHPLNEDQQR